MVSFEGKLPFSKVVNRMCSLISARCFSKTVKMTVKNCFKLAKGRRTSKSLCDPRSSVLLRLLELQRMLRDIYTQEQAPLWRKATGSTTVHAHMRRNIRTHVCHRHRHRHTPRRAHSSSVHISMSHFCRISATRSVHVSVRPLSIPIRQSVRHGGAAVTRAVMRRDISRWSYSGIWEVCEPLSALLRNPTELRHGV